MAVFFYAVNFTPKEKHEIFSCRSIINLASLRLCEQLFHAMTQRRKA